MPGFRRKRNTLWLLWMGRSYSRDLSPQASSAKPRMLQLNHAVFAVVRYANMHIHGSDFINLRNGIGLLRGLLLKELRCWIRVRYILGRYTLNKWTSKGSKSRNKRSKNQKVKSKATQRTRQMTERRATRRSAQMFSRMFNWSQPPPLFQCHPFPTSTSLNTASTISTQF